MGEFIPSPHTATDGKGASADVGKYLQAAALAAQLGKTVEEVLAFMGTSKPVVPPSQADVPIASGQLLPNILSEEILAISEEPIEEVSPQVKAKAAAPKKEALPDETGFVVTRVIDPTEATQEELDQVFPEEENNWDGKIREGSKVKVTYNVPGSRIKWSGKIGKVIRIIGNEQAKVYEVEFKGQKIKKVKLNKKTGKLEEGYENKRLATTFDQEDIELVD